MAHEIAHMFGLTHCSYFECMMDGVMHESANRTKITTFCPVCLKKLHCQLKFNTRERYQKLLEVTKSLGFDEEVKIYERILSKA